MALKSNNVFNIIRFLGGHADNAFAAPLLCGVGVGGQPLDVTAVSEGDNALVLLYKVLKIDIVRSLSYLGSSRIGIFPLYFKRLIFYYRVDFCFVGKYCAKFRNCFVKLVSSSSILSRSRPVSFPSVISTIACA